MPVLAASRAHWRQRSPPGALPVHVLCGLGASPSWPQAPAPAAPASPSFSFCRLRSWPLGGCLPPRSPFFSLTPVLPPDSSPSGRSPRGSAKPRAQAAGPGEADQAPFQWHPCPGARPPVGVRTVASGLGQVPSRAAEPAGDRHMCDDVTRCAAGRVPLGGRGGGAAPGGPHARLTALEDWPMAMGPAGQVGPSWTPRPLGPSHCPSSARSMPDVPGWAHGEAGLPVGRAGV